MAHAKRSGTQPPKRRALARTHRNITVDKTAKVAMSREMLAAGLAAAAASITASPKSRKAIRDAGLNAADSSTRATSSVRTSASKLGSIIAAAVADAAHRVLSGSSEVEVQAPARRVGDLEGEGMGSLLSQSEFEAQLRSIIDDESADWTSSQLLGVLDAAHEIGVARSTLDQWRRTGKVLAFSKGLRNFVFPMEQFVRSKPVEGLQGVRRYFHTDEDAWEWLVTPDPILDGRKPINVLREGCSKEVIRAAEGALDFA